MTNDYDPEDAPGYEVGEAELLPCPFCGSVYVQMGGIIDYKWWVLCATCFTVGPRHSSESKAVALWNTRAAQDTAAP